MIDFAKTSAAMRQQLFSKALLFTRSRAAAEDLVQDAFLRALEAWPRWTPEPGIPEIDAFRGWMYTIIANLAIGEARTRERRAQVLEHAIACGDAELHLMGPRPPAPDEEIIRQQAAQDLLGRMSDEQRAVAGLAALGYISDEIGPMVGMDPRNARKHLYRIRVEVRLTPEQRQVVRERPRMIA